MLISARSHVQRQSSLVKQTSYPWQRFGTDSSRVFMQYRFIIKDNRLRLSSWGYKRLAKRDHSNCPSSHDRRNGSSSQTDRP